MISGAAATRELERRRRQALHASADPLGHLPWRGWHQEIAPNIFTADYSDHHVEFWEWVTSIGDGRPTPIELIFPRGHAKSTGAEIAIVMLAAKGLRGYWLYVSGTESQAIDHVTSISEVLESEGIRRHYPHLSSPKVGLHGNQRGYRQTRLWTDGLIVDAVGLDVAKRGAKLGTMRPDGMVIDDVDGEHDTADTTKRKIATITRSLIPALTANAVIMVPNNLVSPTGIVAKLITGQLDMLSGAKRIGPIKAVDGLTYERREGRWVITGGEATWEGMSLGHCEEAMNDMGEDAFVTECQQEVTEVRGSLLDRETIAKARIDVGQKPGMDRIIVAIDPNQTKGNDDAGIIVAGVANVGGVRHCFILDDQTQTTEPDLWRDEAVKAFRYWRAGSFVVERTGLGDIAKMTLRDAPALNGASEQIIEVDATKSKQDRARPVAQLYRDGRVHHVGAFPILEGQWTSWVPGRGKSPGAIDACVHAVTHLLIEEVPGDDASSGMSLIEKYGTWS